MAHDASSAPSPLAARLTAAEARPAYPLMQAAMPHLTLSAWLRHARRITGPRSSPARGVLVARRPGGPLCGAVCYRKVPDLEAGSVLIADHFVALDLLHPESVLAALATGLEHVAGTLGCAEVRALVRGPSAETLRGCGLETRGSILSRPLPCARTVGRIMRQG